MKRKILTTLTLTLTVGLFVTFTSCNSGSGNKRGTSVSNENATIEMIQGVFEFVPPFQGYVIYIDNRFLVMMGMSDNRMFCTGGKSEISGDTITDIKLFSTNPNEVGNTQPWMAEMLQGDTLKATLFNKDGSTLVVVKMVRKVNLTNEMRSQMKDFEGFFEYTPPLTGMTTMLGGYYIYSARFENGSTMAHTGTYQYQNDTVTNTQHYLLNPGSTGTFRWVEAMNGDTLSWAVINDAGEITQQGNSLKIK